MEELAMRKAYVSALCAWAIGVCVHCAHAQSWEIDAASPVNINATAYADTCFGNGPSGFPTCCEHPPPGALGGPCPPFLFMPAGYPQWILMAPPAEVQLYPNSMFFGAEPRDFGVLLDPVALDLGPFPIETRADALAWIIIDGEGSRTLVAQGYVRTSGHGIDDDYVSRACATLTCNLAATVRNPSPQHPFVVRYDWTTAGDVHMSNGHECEDPIWVFECTDIGYLIPTPDDPAQATWEMELGIGGAAPGVLVPPTTVANFGPGAPLLSFTNEDTDAMTFGAGSNNVLVNISMDGAAADAVQWPVAIEEYEAGFQGSVTLHLVSHEFNTRVPFDRYMRQVLVMGLPGEGPQYCFRVGAEEITNQQYADFLNSAEFDAGQSELSSFMQFNADGDVTLADGTPLFTPNNLASESKIVYSPGALLGTRYTVVNPPGKNPRTNEQHPVTHVSWYGALKFCNWLTIKLGLAPSERCYTEGGNAASWHPATISDADWATRDLNDSERAALLALQGIRLPMDNLGSLTGFVGSQSNDYNEWYKAAALSPHAPNTSRIGFAGETIDPYHWQYGFGRDTITRADANYFTSGDPFETTGSSFTAMFDGTTLNQGGNGDIGSGAQFRTMYNANPWRIYDMSGNVEEWVQDRVDIAAGTHAVRGGGWQQLFGESAASYRREVSATPTPDESVAIGFRIVQAICPPVCIADIVSNVTFAPPPDGVVDAADLAFLLGEWGFNRSSPANFVTSATFQPPPDDVVDAADLAFLLGEWGPCP
jgi:formylglycine-generating enzyme required for sulfatase activity